jgi:hypothetical protein
MRPSGEELAMTRKARAAIVLLLGAASCDTPSQAPLGQQPRVASVPEHGRGVERGGQHKGLPLNTGPIDWQASAGVFIGVERFHPGVDSPAEVKYAADDAVDLAYLFTEELDLLPPARTVLLLSGRHHKSITQRHLADLASQATVLQEMGGDDSQAAKEDVSVKPELIYSQIASQAQKVGPRGVLILSIATHGFTTNGQHILLTAEASTSDPKGVILTQVIQHAQTKNGDRLLLFVDACREHSDGGPGPVLRCGTSADEPSQVDSAADSGDGA